MTLSLLSELLSLGTFRKSEVATENSVFGVERNSQFYDPLSISQIAWIFFLFVEDLDAFSPKWKISEMLGCCIFKQAVDLRLLWQILVS